MTSTTSPASATATTSAAATKTWKRLGLKEVRDLGDVISAKPGSEGTRGSPADRKTGVAG
jgi:hypothetical protein